MTLESSSVNGTKSAIKWVGGKKRIAKEIVAFFPDKYSSYFEPFLGGASVFLEASPKRAYLSDLNPSLINFYEVLRDKPNKLVDNAEMYEREFNALVSQAAKKAFYYRVRSDYNQETNVTGIENATRFLFLNKTAFNGLYRENSKGEFNVPFNNKEKLKLFELGNILDNSKALKGVQLTASTFTDAIKPANSGDVVYFDPPYIPLSTTAAFTDYTKSSFGPEEQEQLRDVAANLVSKGATVVLSNSYSPEVKKLYKDFELHELSINRLVAASSASRGAVREYLIVGRPSV
jgi:DNA adenine methylase